MDYLIGHLKKWQEGQKPFPKIIQLHLTNKCNLSCDFCPTVALKKKEGVDYSEELEKEDWERIIEQGNELGVREWHICGGGEPLFNTSDALDLMKNMKSNSARGQIITNCTLLDEDSCRRLINMGWDLVTFSLDGPSKKINDNIRDQGSFKKAVRNAKLLSNLREGEKPFLRLHTVICNQNYDKMAEMVELTHRIGFDEVKFNAMNVWSEEGEKLTLSQNQIERAKREMKRADDLSNKLNVESNLKQFIEKDILENADNIDNALKKESKGKGDFSDLNCYYPWYNISIFADGRASPCFLFHEGVSLKEKSLKEAWRGEFFKKIRKSFLNNELRETCKNCNAWNIEKMEELRQKLK